MSPVQVTANKSRVRLSKRVVNFRPISRYTSDPTLAKDNEDDENDYLLKKETVESEQPQVQTVKQIIKGLNTDFVEVAKP